MFVWTAKKFGKSNKNVANGLYITPFFPNKQQSTNKQANKQQPQHPTNNSQQPTTNNQQPTTNNQQPTTNNQQPTTNNQQNHTQSYLPEFLEIVYCIVISLLSAQV